MSIDELETQYGAPSASGPDDLLPPQDVNAERSVIGSMLMSKDAIADVAEQVRGEDFYRPAHETIFDAITEMLPDEVREPARPTLAELALTYPDGVVPDEDRWYAVDGGTDSQVEYGE